MNVFSTETQAGAAVQEFPISGGNKGWDIQIGDGAKVAGTSGVAKSLPPGAIAIGTPAETQREFMARLSLPSRFEKLKKQVDELKQKVESLLK